VSELADHLLKLGFEPLEDAFAPLAERDVAALEKRFGPLPDDYRAFIQKIGGTFFAGQATVDGCPLGLVYGATTNRSLTSRINMYEKRIPETMIPIADGRGDQFLLCVSGPDKGAVFHWDHHREPDPDDYIDRGRPVPEGLMYSNVKKVAPSFAQFVRSILVKGESPVGVPKKAAPRQRATSKKKAASKKASPKKRAAKRSS
jgi:hypothetical protein